VLASLFGHRFWITAYILLVAGFVIPGDYAQLRVCIPWLLGGILFFSCLKVTPSDMVFGINQPGIWWRLSWLSLVKLVVLPFSAWGLAVLFAPQWAPGILLMSLMPAGFSSIAFADLYHGNRLTALLLMMIGSLAVPFSVPLFLGLCTGRSLSLTDSLSEVGYVATLLFCPFVAAQVVRLVMPKVIERYYAHWGHLSIACVCLLMFVAVAVNRVSWSHLPTADLLLPLMLSTGAIMIFVAGGWLQGRWLERREGISFLCSAIYMNNGLSVAYAAKFYPHDPHMVLPSILVQFPMMACIVIVGWLLSRTHK
jgi:predicted Na+-dependent transporter